MKILTLTKLGLTALLIILFLSCKKDEGTKNSGAVYDYGNGEPIADATVSLYNFSPILDPGQKVLEQVQTDASGKYTIGGNVFQLLIPTKENYWSLFDGGYRPDVSKLYLFRKSTFFIQLMDTWGISNATFQINNQTGISMSLEGFPGLSGDYSYSFTSGTLNANNFYYENLIADSANEIHMYVSDGSGNYYLDTLMTVAPSWNDTVEVNLQF